MMNKILCLILILCFSCFFSQTVFGFTDRYGKICLPHSGYDKTEILDCKEIPNRLEIVINLKENYFKLGDEVNGIKYIINEVYEKHENGTIFILTTEAISGKKYLGRINFNDKSLGLVDDGGYIYLFGSNNYVYDEYLFTLSVEIIGKK